MTAPLTCSTGTMRVRTPDWGGCWVPVLDAAGAKESCGSDCVWPVCLAGGSLMAVATTKKAPFPQVGGGGTATRRMCVCVEGEGCIRNRVRDSRPLPCPLGRLQQRVGAAASSCVDNALRLCVHTRASVCVQVLPAPLHTQVALSPPGAPAAEAAPAHEAQAILTGLTTAHVKSRECSFCFCSGLLQMRGNTHRQSRPVQGHKLAC